MSRASLAARRVGEPRMDMLHADTEAARASLEKMHKLEAKLRKAGKLTRIKTEFGEIWACGRFLEQWQEFLKQEKR